MSGYELYEMVADMNGEDWVNEQIVRALSDDDLRENLEWICEQWDLQIDDEDDEDWDDDEDDDE